jgi:hypothetical protein
MSKAGGKLVSPRMDYRFACVLLTPNFFSYIIAVVLDSIESCSKSPTIFMLVLFSLTSRHNSSNLCQSCTTLSIERSV